jgi:hypothetical protein
VKLYGASYVVLENLVPDASNQYSIHVRESLPEMDYFDEAKLLIVDHAVGTSLVSSSAANTYSFGYADPFQLYTIQTPQPLLAAVDQSGTDLLGSLGACDGHPAPVHVDSLDAYTLDFGDAFDASHAKLVLEGWSIYSAVLRGTGVVEPYVEVLDATGAWVQVKSFGAPAGDLKRLVVDLSGLFQNSRKTVRVNLGKRSGARWLLDCARLTWPR